LASQLSTRVVRTVLASRAVKSPETGLSALRHRP
jgi:hypothetical protein